jgi:glycosyltransferase involved in cell wall biosynthesis
VERLLHYLQEIDHEHDYVVLLKPQDIDSWVPTNPRFTSLACPHKEFTFDEQLGLKKQLDEIGADLVHFTMVQQPILYRGKVVTTIHDLTTVRFLNPDKNPYVLKIKQQVYKQVIKRAARKSLAVITPTEFVKQDIVDFTGISPDKVTVTLESADAITDAPQAMEGLKSKQFLMYIGRPTLHKNLERLIEAFELLKQTRPELHLVLAVCVVCLSLRGLLLLLT